MLTAIGFMRGLLILKTPPKSGFNFTVIADNFPGADLDFFTNWMGAKLLHI